MQITLENLSNLERKLQVTVPAELIEDKVKLKLNEITRMAKMPGFRPGKVPLAVIKNTYTQSAHAEVLEKILKDTYIEALQQEKLNPVNSPDIKFVSSNLGEPLVYTATFEVYPEIKLIDLGQAEIEKLSSQIIDSDVDEALEKMRKNHVTWQEITDDLRKAKVGDRITIDLTIKASTPDEVAEPKTEKDIEFVLGDGSMWKDFEEALYGLSTGEEKQFILQVPDTHIDKTIAGKKVEFNVKVHQVCEPILPSLDDEFAAKMKIKEGGVAKLKEVTRGHMERELQAKLKDLFTRAIMDRLLEVNQFEIPKFLIAKELKKNEEEWRQRFAKHYGSSQNMPVFPRDDYELQVKRNLALGLLMAEIIKMQNLKVSQDEIRGKIKELMAAYYDDADDMLTKLFDNQRYLDGIEAMMLEEKVIDHLATQVKPVEKNISYKDLMLRK